MRVAIGALRKILGDTAQTPRFIATVPRRGYRFLASVVEDIGVVSSSTGPAAPAPRRWPWAAAAALVLLFVGLGLGEATGVTDVHGTVVGQLITNATSST